MEATEITYLINKVDELKANGVKKKDAFEMLATELETTTATIIGRYYSHKNKDVIFESTTPVNNDQKKFVNETVQKFIKEGKKVQDALLYCADSLQITYQKARGIWEHVRTNENKTRERINWDEEQDAILINTLIDELQKNNTLSNACEIADKKLNKKLGRSMNRWQNMLRKIHGDKINALHKFKWNDKKDEILLETIKEGIKNGSTLKQCFIIAADNLDITPSICESRYNAELKKRKVELGIKRGGWTKEEDETLLSIMNIEIKRGKTDWDAAHVADKILSRGHRSCLSRYNYAMKTDIRKIPRWTNDETQTLIKCVKETQTLIEAFKLAAAKLENRDVIACQNRWQKIKQRNIK